MSYFSNLSVNIIEPIRSDTAYPVPLQQLFWRYEDVIDKYICLGGHQIQTILDDCGQDIAISSKDISLLYSSEAMDSRRQLQECIRIAHHMLMKYINEIDADSDDPEKMIIETLFAQSTKDIGMITAA